MAFDEKLATRVRTLLRDTPAIVEKRMFGGVAFLVRGNMSVGVHGSELIVRVEPESTDAALRRSGVRIFDITGKPMRGWLLVSGTQLAGSRSLASWVKKGVAFAQSLPKK